MSNKTLYQLLDILGIVVLVYNAATWMFGEGDTSLNAFVCGMMGMWIINTAMMKKLRDSADRYVRVLEENLEKHDPEFREWKRKRDAGV